MESIAFEAVLDSESKDEWLKLKRFLSFNRGFSFVVVIVQQNQLLNALADEIKSVLSTPTTLLRPERTADVEAIPFTLLSLAGIVRGAVCVEANLGHTNDDSERNRYTRSWREVFHRLNERRDVLRSQMGAPIFLIGTSWLKSELRDAAPDLWSIRSLVVELSSPDTSHVDKFTAPTHLHAEQGSSTPLFAVRSLSVNCAQVNSRGDRSQSAFLLTHEIAISATGLESGPIDLFFPESGRSLSGLLAESNQDLDYSLIELTTSAPTLHSIPIGGQVYSGDLWAAYIPTGHGLYISGRVADVTRTELMLRTDVSEYLAWPGFAGSPVVVGNAVVGIVSSRGVDKDAMLIRAHLLRPILSQTKKLGLRRLYENDGASEAPQNILRPELEQIALGELRHPGSALVISGGPGTGKTTFAHQVATRWRRAGFVAVFVDLAQVGPFGDFAYSRVEPFFASIADAIVREFTSATDIQVRYAGWRETIGSPSSLITNLLTDILRRCSELLIIFDDSDFLAESPAGEQFLRVARSWSDMRRSPWDRLRMAFLTRSEPGILSNRLGRASILRMPGLTQSELSRLADEYGIQLSPDLSRELAAATGGHPLLVSLALRSSRDEDVPLTRIVAGLPSTPSALSRHLETLDAQVSASPALERLIYELVVGQFTGTQADFNALSYLGVVVRRGDVVAFSNPLYAGYFRDRCLERDPVRVFQQLPNPPDIYVLESESTSQSHRAYAFLRISMFSPSLRRSSIEPKDEDGLVERIRAVFAHDHNANIEMRDNDCVMIQHRRPDGGQRRWGWWTNGWLSFCTTLRYKNSGRLSILDAAIDVMDCFSLLCGMIAAGPVALSLGYEPDTLVFSEESADYDEQLKIGGIEQVDRRSLSRSKEVSQALLVDRDDLYYLPQRVTTAAIVPCVKQLHLARIDTLSFSQSLDEIYRKVRPPQAV